MAKFKIGDKCIVIKNALAPNCVGNMVEVIDSYQGVEADKAIYRIKVDDINGFASEGCLKLIKYNHQRKSKLKKYVIILSKTFPKGYGQAGQRTLFREKTQVALGCPQCDEKQDLSGENITHCNSCMYATMQPKLHTIRGNYTLWKKRIEEVNRGEACISLREWSGKPYRSQQREIAVLTADNGVGLQRLVISRSEWIDKDKHFCYWAKIDGKEINIDEIAKNDGFSDVGDCVTWFDSDMESQIPDKDGWKHLELAIIHFTSYRY